MLHKFYHHLPIRASKVQIQWKTLARVTFLLAPERKRVISYVVLKVICPQCTVNLSDLGNCYFLVSQNACPNLTFSCPRQLGKCLCSTLVIAQICRFYTLFILCRCRVITLLYLLSQKLLPVEYFIIIPTFTCFKIATKIETLSFLERKPDF